MNQQRLKIEKLVYGGEGLSRGPEGVVLVPFTLAGETIEAGVGGLEKGVRRGKLLRVEEASPDRVTPLCPYFTRCGGCHYQHLSYAAQLAAKRAILEETLLRVAKIAPPEPVEVISGEPWQYRNRVQLHFADGRMGYRAAHSREVIEIGECPIASPLLNRTIAKLAVMAKNSRWPRFLGTLELFSNEEAVQLNVQESGRPVARRFFEWAAEEIPWLAAPLGAGPLNYAGFQVSKGSFFQVNRFLAGRLAAEVVGDAVGDAVRDAVGDAARDAVRGAVRDAVGHAVGDVPGDSGGGTALDLYAGVGLFSLALKPGFERVVAVESGAGAVRDLEANAAKAGLSIETRRSTVERFLEEYSEPCDLVVADPPRAGLGKLAVKRLIGLGPGKITLVACDPATMARDLAPLVGAGYRLEKMVLVDLFPHTYHLEAIAKLVKY